MGLSGGEGGAVVLMRWAAAYRKAASSRTLYHGTSIPAARSILQEGLAAQLGEFTSEFYDPADYSSEADLELAFAGDKAGMRGVVSALLDAVARSLGKNRGDVSAEDVRAVGAVLVFPEGESEFDHRPADADWWEEAASYPTVEPGNYFTPVGGQMPERVLSGPALVRFLRRAGEWPLTTMGPGTDRANRERLIKAMRGAHPEMSAEHVIETVDELSAREFRDYMRVYVG